MFHLKEGWFFERLSDGSVMVTKRKDAGSESPIITRMIVPPNEWASVVASVSAGGELNGRWKSALDFHSGLTMCPADGASTLPDSIQEALNSGDGTYRP